MTYFRFHLIFNFPLLILLVLGAGLDFWRTPVLCAAGLVLMAVMVFTTPWDNYAVARGIWGFPKERYWFRMGWLPAEEYLFFILESLEVMLLLRVLLEFFPKAATWPAAWDPAGLQAIVISGALLFLWLGIGLHFGPRIAKAHHWHYAWHLLYWFLPLIALQWVIAWPVIVPRLPLLLAATAAIGSWLSLADWVAVRRGIWFFDENQISGWKLGGLLPWEEIAFFYLTAFLVAQSFIILLPENLR